MATVIPTGAVAVTPLRSKSIWDARNSQWYYGMSFGSSEKPLNSTKRHLQLFSLTAQEEKVERINSAGPTTFGFTCYPSTGIVDIEVYELPI